MFDGICTECGAHYYGNALYYEKHRTCPKCGGRIVLSDEIENGERTRENGEGTKQDPRATGI